VPPRILLVGLDGADLEQIDDLAAAGRLPHLDRLMAAGVTGELATVANASPIVWTSIATGVVPEKHGIEFFRSEGRPAASTMRRRPAFWNILSHYGHSVGVLAWWATFPAERVRGYLISPYVLLMPPRGTTARVEGFWKAGDPRKTHPPELQASLADLVYLEDDLDLASLGRLYADPERTTNTGWALAKDRSYYEMARRLMASRPVEVVAVYFQGIDAASHDFDRHVYGGNVNRVREPRVAGEEVDAAWARVEAMYEHADALVGGLLEHTGEQSDVLVVSDHGWSYDGTGHWNNDPGVFIAVGPSVAARGRLSGLSVLDVTPVLLTILGVPLSHDFDGAPPADLLRRELTAAARWVDAYPIPPVAPTGDATGELPEDEVMLERLRSLGYLSETG
jgi:predicted AlkP superfamily phosphohydrolase/phosphomutase